MTNNRVEYIFRVCGCRSDKFIYQNKSKKLKLCVKHRTRIESKIRWCSVCGKETICNTRSNSKKFVCSDCRRTNSLAVKRIRESKRVRVSTGFRANTGKSHLPGWEIPLAIQILNKKFPKVPIPEMSSDLKRICGAS